jgi:hypothetical protein
MDQLDARVLEVLADGPVAFHLGTDEGTARLQRMILAFSLEMTPERIAEALESLRAEGLAASEESDPGNPVWSITDKGKRRMRQLEERAAWEKRFRRIDFCL